MAKRFKQFRLNTGSGTNNLGSFDSGKSQYSENLLNTSGKASTVYELAIYARPGTRFKANAQGQSGEDWEFTVNALGIFQMELSDRPIVDLRVYSPTGKSADLGPIIIDVICQEGASI